MSDVTLGEIIRRPTFPAAGASEVTGVIPPATTTALQTGVNSDLADKFFRPEIQRPTPLVAADHASLRATLVGGGVTVAAVLASSLMGVPLAGGLLIAAPICLVTGIVSANLASRRDGAIELGEAESGTRMRNGANPSLVVKESLEAPPPPPPGTLAEVAHQREVVLWRRHATDAAGRVAIALRDGAFAAVGDDAVEVTVRIPELPHARVAAHLWDVLYESLAPVGSVEELRLTRSDKPVEPTLVTATGYQTDSQKSEQAAQNERATRAAAEATRAAPPLSGHTDITLRLGPPVKGVEYSLDRLRNLPGARPNDTAWARALEGAS